MRLAGPKLSGGKPNIASGSVDQETMPDATSHSQAVLRATSMASRSRSSLSCAAACALVRAAVRSLTRCSSSALARSSASCVRVRSAISVCSASLSIASARVLR